MNQSVRRSGDRQGQSHVEYALLICLMVMASLLGLVALGLRTQDAFCSVLAPLGLEAWCATFFNDTFENLAAWQIDQGNWRIENGQLCGGRGEGRIFREIPAGDYTITINGASLAQGPGYGVFFRSSGAPSVNGYTFQYDPGYGRGEFLFRKWVEGRELSPFGRAAAPDEDWYAGGRTVRLVISGQTFTAYLDGQQVLQASDESYGEGGIGLRTWGGTEVCFDGISVGP